APAMERHRHDNIGIRPEFLSRALHPLSERGSQMRAVRALESDQEMAAGIIINQCRAGFCKFRRLLDAGAAKNTLTHRHIERLAAAAAERGSYETHAAPAFGAERAITADRRIAGKAQRRQKQIAGAIRQLPERRGKSERHED